MSQLARNRAHGPAWYLQLAVVITVVPACSKNATQQNPGSLGGAGAPVPAGSFAPAPGEAGTPAPPAAVSGRGGSSTAPMAAAGAPSGGAGGASATAPSAGTTAAAGASGAAGAAGGSSMATAGAGGGSGMRDVLLVGNSVSGSVSFIDAHTFENLGSVNVVPDMSEVMGLISGDIVRSIAYPVIKQNQLLHHFEPGDGDRFVDDVFVSPDGAVLYVSRSNLGDVAAFDLTKPKQPRIWRNFVDGVKADHATISPDGKHLVVSATSATVSDVIDTKTGKVIATFPTGDFPHQNDYSADGKHIYNSSIGNVGFEAVTHANNAQKGNRWLVQVDATTFKVTRTWKFEWGIRPNIVTADETIMYAQLSYLNGVIKYDLTAGKEIARSDQPLSEFAMKTYKTYDEYPHDSAHHGLALSGDGKRLCDCGTIDNTVAIVTTADMKVEKMIDVGQIPYWATSSADGMYCYVSLSGDNAIAVIDYAAGSVVKLVPVGKFPQRNRLARIPAPQIAMLNPSPG